MTGFFRSCGRLLADSDPFDWGIEDALNGAKQKRKEKNQDA